MPETPEPSYIPKPTLPVTTPPPIPWPEPSPLPPGVKITAPKFIPRKYKTTKGLQEIELPSQPKPPNPSVPKEHE